MVVFGHVFRLCMVSVLARIDPLCFLAGLLSTHPEVKSCSGQLITEANLTLSLTLTLCPLPNPYPNPNLNPDEF